MNWIEIYFIFVIVLLGISNIISIIAMYKIANPEKKKKKKFRCPNNYNCGDCIHLDMYWEGIKFRGFSCRLDR